MRVGEAGHAAIADIQVELPEQLHLIAPPGDDRAVDHVRLLDRPRAVIAHCHVDAVDQRGQSLGIVSAEMGEQYHHLGSRGPHRRHDFAHGVDRVKNRHIGADIGYIRGLGRRQPGEAEAHAGHLLDQPFAHPGVCPEGIGRTVVPHVGGHVRVLGV